MGGNMLQLHDRLRAAMAARAEGEEADAGFTLIELMVVLLILGILLAIAIPTFLGVRGSAYDKSAQSDLTNILTEAKASYTNTQDFSQLVSSGTVQAAFAAQEPQFHFTLGTTNNGTSAGQRSLSIDTFASSSGGPPQAFGETEWAPNSNHCWGILDIESTMSAWYGDGGSMSTSLNVGNNGTNFPSSPGVYYFEGTSQGNCYADELVLGGVTNVTVTSVTGTSFGQPYSSPI
jgi:prepilin-type N-terminal cleavage/methylation domain-containing protein